MSQIVRIELNGLRFFAFHGVHPFEAKTGGVFEVDVRIECRVEASALVSDDLSGTVDYEKVRRIVAERMERRAQLLEHLASDIVISLKSIENVMAGEVCVKKLNPPLGGSCKDVSVTLSF
jgi:7,8-dihydroneopterin aldolase/epimerase/oxygenase